MIKKYLMIGLLLTGGLYSCDQQSSNKMPENSTADTVVLKENENRASNDVDIDAEWNAIDWNMPAVRMPDITARGVEVRGNDRYTNYSVDETVLFDVDKAKLRSGAKESLQQVAKSISQRSQGNIRIYGHTDATASKGYNKELSEERAQAVKQWLTKDGKIAESRISIHPMGESQPKATNETAKGRQKNRRVEIVVMNEGNGNNNNPNN
jgi:outer membrane protein OmpA-like peptidoglycan-associated protein